MTEIKKNVDSFLKKYGMHHDSVDIEKGCRDFIDEMARGLSGEKSSLRMICTYLSPEGDIPLNEPVAVMDAGGTNFRVALVRFGSDKKPVIEYFETYPMPGSKGELTREEFYDTVADYLLPVADQCGRIGWCFSFPTEILPNKDGKLLHFDKEIQVTGMDGKPLGASLLKTLEEKGVKGRKEIVMLNDTVATLLGGKAAYPDRDFGSYIGFILGTGVNICYIEENSTIKKLPEVSSKPGYTIINTESGGFDRAPRGSIDIAFDSATVDPGAQQLEKMISGAYQGSLLRAILLKALRDGLFSKEYAAYFENVPALTTRDISEFCLYPYSDTGVLAKGCRRADPMAENDRQTLYWLIDALIERAAKLTAMKLAATVIKSGRGTNPCLPVCIAAEGTTFYKSPKFREKLDYYVKSSLNDKMGIFCEFIRAENATLTGTAIAGLLNK